MMGMLNMAQLCAQKVGRQCVTELREVASGANIVCGHLCVCVCVCVWHRPRLVKRDRASSATLEISCDHACMPRFARRRYN